MSFEFNEDSIKKGSTPFTSGVYPMVIESFYIAEREGKEGNRYFNVGLVAVESETERKFFAQNFQGVYGGSIDEDGRWNFKTKDGKKDQRSLEFINTFLFLAGLPTFSGTDMQDKLQTVSAKVKEFGKDVEVLMVKDLIGKEFNLGLKVVEDGYEKEGQWVDTSRAQIEAVFDVATNKTAFEKAGKKPAKFIDDFNKAFPEDYVEAMWDKSKIATRDKLQAFAGADTSVATETDTTSGEAPVATNEAIDAL